MPLKRGEIIGYDAERMVYEFTMINDFDTIDCEISNAALNVLARAWENDQLPDRGAHFLKFRDLIEQAAAHQFELDGVSPVRIFAKHFPRDKEK
jgi:hypothetical protein